MALLAPRPLHFQAARRVNAWRLLALLTMFTVIGAGVAPAQVVVGGDRSPSVSVDLTVLDRLGAAPTLPQLFGASGGGTSVATPPPAQRSPAATASRKSSSATAKHTRTRRVARRKTKSGTRVAQAHKTAPAAAASAIHLTPPTGGDATRIARSARAPSLATPVRPAAAVSVTPPPASPPIPAAPQAAALPTTPSLAPTTPPEVAPAPPRQPSPTADDQSAASVVAPQPSVGPAPQPPAPPPDVASAKPAAPAPAAAPPAPVQVASAGSAALAPSVVKFAPGAADLPPGSQAVLDGVAAKMLASDAIRVQLIAHATGDADQAMEARRVSLARAVAVRAYLIDKGVRSLRMDVRALGNRADDGPVGDQVDLVLVNQ